MLNHREEKYALSLNCVNKIFGLAHRGNRFAVGFCLILAVATHGLASEQPSTLPLPLADSPSDLQTSAIEVTAGTVLIPSVTPSGFGDGSRIQYSLDPAGDSIGYFEGDRFITTRVGTGAIIATSGEQRQISARITVRPSQLTEILLSISANQVVGNALVGTAKLVMLDEFSNLLTTYDLQAEPISLICDGGVLGPSLIADTLLFDSGVVDFSSLGSTYTGPSSRVGIYATNGTVSSNTVVVSFNGYDTHSALDLLGDTVSIIYADLTTDIRAIVSNGGDLVAGQLPQLKAYFVSGGGSVKKLFMPHAKAIQDTIVINLPTNGLLPGNDTLILECDSKYQIGDSLLASVSYAYFPVTVFGPVSLSLVDGSVQPDSVYADVQFSVGLDAKITGLTAPVDSARVVLSLADNLNGPIVSTIFSGLPPVLQINDSILRFSGILALAKSTELTPGATYVYRAGLTVYSGGNLVKLDSTYDGDLTIVAPSALAIDSGSLVPFFVTERDEKPFAFDIFVPGTRRLLINPGTASLRVQTTGFSNSISILIDSNVLLPGLNHVTTDKIIIPSVAAGQYLTLIANLDYRVDGAANEKTFVTNFDGKTIFVREQPHVRILSTKSLAPNETRVNTGQQFHVAVTVYSTAEFDNLSLQLRSEGESQFQGDRLISHIDADDTVTVDYIVIADDTPTPAEVFTADFLSPEVQVDPPKDNVEVITIERPASLTLSHSLVGTVNGVVSPRANFGLNVQLVNSGEAQITPGVYTLTAGGVPVGIEDPLTDTIGDRIPIGYELTAPNFDTTIQFNLTMTQLPIDNNTGLPAAIDQSGFSATVFVSELDAHLQVDVTDLGSGVAAPGENKDIATIRLSVAGTSTLSGVRLKDLEIRWDDGEGNPIDSRGIVVVGNTGWFDGQSEVSRTTAGGDRVRFDFDNLTVTATDSIELTLRALLQSELPDRFRVMLKVSEIRATYDSGPLAGQDILVVGPNGDEVVFEIPFEVTGRDFSSSFVVRDNPYNPDNGPAEFRFLSSKKGDVLFRVFTLDGQLVYERNFPAGSLSTAGDQHDLITWDGRNGHGDSVRNGVYLVVLTDSATQDRSVLKLAVIR